MRLIARLLVAAAATAGMSVAVPAPAYAECSGLQGILEVCADEPTVAIVQTEVVEVHTCLIVDGTCVLPVDREVVAPMPQPTVPLPSVNCPVCPYP